MGSHYGSLLDEAYLAGSALKSGLGLCAWARRGHETAWPRWAERDGLAIATSDTPSGWSRLAGPVPPGSEAALRLGEVIATDAERASELNPPFALAVLDSERETLTVVNDCVGVGRLYELRFDAGSVWSNRLGALALFSGREPVLDDEAWGVFAACGWFLGAMTPLKGARKAGHGYACRATPREMDVVGSDSLRELVSPRRASFKEAAGTAAEHVTGLVEDLASLSERPLAIALTGGRDSRLSAAGALAAGVEATYNTGDQEPGEVDVVRDLIAAAPRPMRHEVFSPQADDEPDDSLAERVRAIHLVHDGMRNPQELRRTTEIPYTGSIGTSLSGHGGEIGHGFYYGDRRRLRKLERGGDGALVEQLERNARRRHSAAVPSAYDAYLAECRATLAQGAGYGLAGPVLLDFFYLAQRLAYRSGLGARTGRASVCVTPGFIRAGFDLSPKDRLAAKLHRAVTAKLVPEWKRVDYFSGDSGTMPAIKRRRIWERPDEAAEMEEILASPESWSDVFDVARIRDMWTEVRSGGGSSDYEHVFDRIVWKVGYGDHLAELRRALR